MDKLIVMGQKQLKGEVCISGAKNAAVAIIPAAIMADDVSIIENLFIYFLKQSKYCLSNVL